MFRSLGGRPLLFSVAGFPWLMTLSSTLPVSVHGRPRRRRVDVPHVKTGLTDVALQPAVLVRDDGSNGAALWAFGGRERFAGLDIGAWNISPPWGSTGSRHESKFTGNGRRRWVLK